MTAREFIETTVPKLNKELNKTCPRLNSGGCGHFAYELGKLLKKRNIPFKIMVIHWEDEDINERYEVLNNLKCNNKVKDTTKLAPAHLCLEVDGVLLDGHLHGEDLEHKWFKYMSRTIIGQYTLQDLNLALRYGGWNESFNVSTQLPKLKKILKSNIN